MPKRDKYKSSKANILRDPPQEYVILYKSFSDEIGFAYRTNGETFYTHDILSFERSYDGCLSSLSLKEWSDQPEDSKWEIIECF